MTSATKWCGWRRSRGATMSSREWRRSGVAWKTKRSGREMRPSCAWTMCECMHCNNIIMKKLINGVWDCIQCLLTCILGLGKDAHSFGLQKWMNCGLGGFNQVLRLKNKLGRDKLRCSLHEHIYIIIYIPKQMLIDCCHSYYIRLFISSRFAYIALIPHGNSNCAISRRRSVSSSRHRVFYYNRTSSFYKDVVISRYKLCMLM